MGLHKGLSGRRLDADVCSVQLGAKALSWNGFNIAAKRRTPRKAVVRLAADVSQSLLDASD